MYLSDYFLLLQGALLLHVFDVAEGFLQQQATQTCRATQNICSVVKVLHSDLGLLEVSQCQNSLKYCRLVTPYKPLNKENL